MCMCVYVTTRNWRTRGVCECESVRERSCVERELRSAYTIHQVGITVIEEENEKEDNLLKIIL